MIKGHSFIQNLDRYAVKNEAIYKSWGTALWKYLNSGFNIIFKTLVVLILCHCDGIPKKIT